MPQTDNLDASRGCPALNRRYYLTAQASGDCHRSLPRYSHAALRCALFCAASLLCVTSAGGAETLVPREHHEWGRFQPGAWKRVRLINETLGDRGQVMSSSTTETKTTLVDANDDAVTLRVETTVNVSGKRFAKPAKTVTQRLTGAIEGKTVQFRSLGGEQLTIDGCSFRSQVRQLTVSRGSTQWTSKVHYSRDVAPYVLRREISCRSSTKDASGYETRAEVISLRMPYNILGRIMPTSHVRTIHTTPQGKRVTLEVSSEEVPGGFVSHSSKQMDADGNVIGRSTLELLDYGVPGPKTNSHRGYRYVWPRRHHRWGH